MIKQSYLHLGLLVIVAENYHLSFSYVPGPGPFEVIGF